MHICSFVRIVGLPIIITSIIFTVYFLAERTGDFVTIEKEVRALDNKPQVRELYSRDRDHSNDKVAESRPGDCGPLFEAPVDPDATGRRCNYDTYTETLKTVVRKFANQNSGNTSVRDLDMLQSVELSNIMFSVRSSYKFHPLRLSLLMATWLQKVPPSQARITTDTREDQWVCLAKAFGYEVRVTDCAVGHTWSALCCKTGAGYEHYYIAKEKGRNFRWYCHFDDDEYVNVGALVRLLSRYNPERERVYLGHTPPIKPGGSPTRKEINPRRHLDEKFPDRKTSQTYFYYSNGPAYCLSSSLMDELEQYIRGSNFVKTCQKLNYTDDYALGAVIGAILGYNLTDEPLMMNQADHVFTRIQDIPVEKLKEKVTIAAFICGRFADFPNPVFKKEEDPSRFLSYHCLLYPDTPWCKEDIS